MASFFSAPPASLPQAKPIAPNSQVRPLPGSSKSTPFCLQPAITISENTSEVFSVKFSPDGKFLAACCGDGAIRVFNSSTGRMAYNLQKGSSVALPSTAVKFRPDVLTVKTKNVLISADALGNVEHWHMTSGKCLHTFKEENNQVFAVDFRGDATQFATAGKDTCVRIYDESTKNEVTKMERGMGFGPQSAPGHSNRIFSIKFHPSDPNVLISGGWDNTIQIWDTRTGRAQRSIFGPHLCGEALDIQDDTILTGSHRADSPLELWDYGTGEKITSINLFASENSDPSQLYACNFSKAGLKYTDKPKFIACGGSGGNEAR
jgi:WD40 repeat protein